MKKFLQSIFTDKEWDADMAKIAGFALAACGVVGFFMAIDGWQWMLSFGAGLIGWKAHVEGV